MRTIVTSIDYSKDTLKDLCSLCDTGEKEGQVVIPIGIRNDGLIQEDFSLIPSSLIVGTTGSGKSAFVKTVLLEMMGKYSPNQVRIAIYDSRQVDYTFLNTNPYMLVPVINDAEKAKGLIRWSLLEARKRMNALDHIEEFPHIFVIMDDFGEMSPSNDTFSDLIQLFQIARRTRLHFWLVTSTPSSNVFPTDLKANINHRIAFRAASKSISRIYLDDVGAETLNVPGEIIAKLNNETLKCDAVHLDDYDIEALSKNAITKYQNQATEHAESKIILGENRVVSDYFLGEDGRDVLFQQAVDVVLQANYATSSLIQLKLKIGYDRAAKIVDQMEEDGIVGSFEGSKPRAILITHEQWRAQKSGSSGDSSYYAATSLPHETPIYNSEIKHIERSITSPNLTVERSNTRGSGECKTVIYINGIKRKDFDLDYRCKITLPVGSHKIQFKRAAVKSDVIDVTITDRNDKFVLIFKPTLFSIKTIAHKI